MKKIAYLVVLINIVLFPSFVNAYELKCTDGPFNYNDSFMCVIKGPNNLNYDVMKGTIETNPNLSCVVSSYADGMKSNITEDASTKFSLTGRSPNGEYVSFKCQVTTKVTSDTKTQVIVNDFTYHDSMDTNKEKSEILRGNFIELKKYDEGATKPTDNKPRDTSNSNSRLKAIIEDNLDFTFSTFITEYKIDVLYEVDTIDLGIMTYNSQATYRIVGSQKLEIGDNTIDIYVTSPDGNATTCYTLYIKRLARGEEIYYPEQDATLKDLIISGYTIQFDKDTLEYQININYDVDSIDINAIPTYEEATAEVVNSTGLKNGDVVSIIVTSKDGTQSKRYLIKVIKAAAPYDYTKAITLGAVAVLGIIIIFLFIRSSKKNKEDPLLKIKNDKRGINKGQNFDPNAVPEATSQVAPNVIKADDTAVIQPMMVDENAVDTNRNKITSNVNTISLDSKAMPIAIPVGEANNISSGTTNVVNNINPPLPPEEPVEQVNTLNLSATAAPQDLTGIVQPMNSAVNNQNMYDLPPEPQQPQVLSLTGTNPPTETAPQPQVIQLQPNQVAQPINQNTNQNQ